MQVRLFGELQAVEAGMSVAVRGIKQRSLLALLALARGQPVSADRLIDVLWADGQVKNPANALQAQIVQLRRTLGSAAIVTTEAGYALDVGPEDVDVLRFERLVANGRRLVDLGEAEQASATLGAALELRVGEPLAEFTYAGFADGERAYLNELTVEAIEARSAADLLLGRHDELVGELETWCRQYPLRERLWELLILALYRAGRQAEALRAYSEARDRLVKELGIDPGPALQELETRVLAQDPMLTLPGLARPESTAAPNATGNLRARLSGFVGRDVELGQLRDTVLGNRLVTLVGAGGVGKTRLAVEAAAAMGEQHPDGVWLVELAGLTEADGVAPVAASTLGAAAAALAGPQPALSSVELIVRHLAGRSLVVVLDNCEHVIAQAAALANTLVGAVPGLRLIATSREALGVPGEVLLPVGGLSRAAAIELFVDRARMVRPGFTADGKTLPVIEEICGRLDGLPLAVELAAARLRALPLATVAERLDDRFRLLTGGARTALPRQQTLRAVVDWSYDLLFEDERSLFARLSVFAGGCELAAAEAVCADERVPSHDILDVISRLVDKCLVIPPGIGEETRFTQLQTLWQYGRDRLDESGEADAMHANHAAHYRQLAEASSEGLCGAIGPTWRERLTAELANLRAALDWYIAAGDADSALSLASAMGWFWFINTDFAEGVRWLEDALDVGGPFRVEAAATAHAWHGYFVGMYSSPATGVAECRGAVDTLQHSDDRLRRAEALVLCATVEVRANEVERSLENLSEARALLEPARDAWLLATHDLAVAWNRASSGQLEAAEAAARSSLERFDDQEEVLLAVASLNALANIADARGDLEGAAVAYQALLQRCRATGQRLHEPVSLVALAALRARQGADVEADGLYQEAIACKFSPWLSADAMVGQAAVARRLGNLARARRLLEEAGIHYRQLDLPAGQACVFAGLAWWAIAAGQPNDATAFAAEAVHMASASRDPGAQLLGDTVAAAAKAIADPIPRNIESFGNIARQRSHGLTYPTFSDEPDVVALVARLALPTG